MLQTLASMLRSFLLAGLLATTLGTLASAQTSPGEPASDPTARADPGTPPPAFWVRSAGAMREVMMRGDARPNIALDSLMGMPGLWAVGPVEDLQGEITLLDGQAFVTTVEDGALRTRGADGVRAPFLVYASVTEWTAVSMPDALDGTDAIEAFVGATAARAGLDLDAPFPFRIEGDAGWLGYHVIMKDPAETATGHAAHDRAKVPFATDHGAVEIVGFWGPESAEGVFVHRGQRTHLHARVGRAAGHVDHARLAPGATLYLPVR